MKDKESYVSRSVYQKVVEQNKKLLSDIRILANSDLPSSAEKITLMNKWQEQFSQEEEYNKLMAKIFRPKSETKFVQSELNFPDSIM